MTSFCRHLIAAGALFAVALTGAPAQVLYDTNGWEASGSPITWQIGAIVPQNLWRNLNNDPPVPNHLITAATLLGGTLTVTPKTGTQMHQSISSSASINDPRIVLTSMSGNSAAGVGYANRTSGNDTVLVHYDFFLPSTDIASTHLHGIRSWSTAGNLLGGALFRNSDRAINITSGGTVTGLNSFVFPNAVPRDRWFNVVNILDYVNNLVEYYLNGVQVTFTTSDGVYRTGLPMSNTPPAAAFGDADLENRNLPVGSTVNSNAFSDNFTVSAVRSITFSGTVGLEGVSPLVGPAFPFTHTIALLNEEGTSRGQVVLPLFIPDAGNMNQGTYSVRFHDVPDGNYKLYIKPFNNLSRLVDVTVSGSGTVTVPTTAFLAGDADGNDIVDVEDLSLFIIAFDALLDEDPDTEGNQSSVNWDPRADFNYNGIVDVEDLSLFIQNFDKAGEGAGLELVP